MLEVASMKRRELLGSVLGVPLAACGRIAKDSDCDARQEIFVGPFKEHFIDGGTIHDVWHLTYDDHGDGFHIGILAKDRHGKYICHEFFPWALSKRKLSERKAFHGLIHWFDYKGETIA